jgi:hypothetical protein
MTPYDQERERPETSFDAEFPDGLPRKRDMVKALWECDPFYLAVTICAMIAMVVSFVLAMLGLLA